MINEERNKTQNDGPFVASYNMLAVTFVLPDEMADVSIAGLQWFTSILKPWLNYISSHRPSDFHSKPYLQGEKIQNLEQEPQNLLQSYKLQGKQPFISDFSRLLRYMPLYQSTFHILFT